MSSGPPPHQQVISGTSATNGAQTFAGTVHGNVYYGDSGTRQANVPPPKPSSTVPFRRDPDFIDRRDQRGNILNQIDQRCSQPAGRAALVGLGGAGKSQIAIEYAHRVRERSPDTWVFWVHASNITRVESAFKEIADAVALPGRQESTANVLKLVVKWLSNESNGRWLMIVDNADDLAMVVRHETWDEERLAIADLVPQSSNGAVLLTSRDMNVARAMIGREKDIIRVGTMEQQEAVDLLQKKLDTTKDKAADLVAALDNVPLAITQAAAHIHRQPGMTIADYLEQLVQVEARTQLLTQMALDLWRDNKDQKTSNSIFATWQISFDRIQAERPSTAELLSFMSFFNRHGIPCSILRSRGSLQTGWNNSGSDTFDEDIATLNNLSLVTRVGDECAMHGLVQLATRAWLKTHGSEEQWWETYLSTMAALFPTGEYENWATCRSLLPHIQSISERQPSESNFKEWVQVMTNSGWYLWRQGLYSQAEQLLRRSLRYCEVWAKEGDTGLLWNLSLLGCVLCEQRNYSEAEVVTKRALAGREKELGMDHTDTLISLNNLAGLLLEQGKHDEAESMHRQALARREKTLGADHADTLMSLQNLATAICQQKRYGEAEVMYRQALAGREKKLGIHHPDTLMTLNSLATVLDDQGHYGEAEAMYRQALAAREKELGANHPNTLSSLHSLAGLLKDTGKLDQAIPLLELCVERRTKVLGPGHPDTVASAARLKRWRARSRNPKHGRPAQRQADEEVPRRGTISRLFLRSSRAHTSNPNRASR